MPESALPVLTSLGRVMKDSELAKMPVDQLWRLHEKIIQILDRKLLQESRRLQRRLDELGRKFGGSPSDVPQRRPYPKVQPKFRNPNAPPGDMVGTRQATSLGDRVAGDRQEPRRIQDMKLAWLGSRRWAEG